ncbi:MAG: hypothetical protein OSJ61_23165 [Lachnospiraceae bacterium]|nr:hypothetical protein [Lachnospiraceae bacterium]
MKFQFDTNYTEEEMQFLKLHHCQILSEIKLSRTSFSKSEIPRRMFQYYGTYVGEIVDDESDRLAWAVLSIWKGAYHWSGIYSDLWSLEQGL